MLRIPSTRHWTSFSIELDLHHAGRKRDKATALHKHVQGNRCRGEGKRCFPYKEAGRKTVINKLLPATQCIIFISTVRIPCQPTTQSFTFFVTGSLSKSIENGIPSTGSGLARRCPMLSKD